MQRPSKGPIVFVPQEPRYRDESGHWKAVDMLPALDYGSVEPPILETGRQMSVLNAAQLTREFKRRLSGYRDEDFVMAAGDPAAIGLACAVAVLANRGRVTILKWDRL